MNKLSDWFRMRKRVDVLLLLLQYGMRKKYGTIISKKLSMTYSHTNKSLLELEEFKLITLKRQGRIKLVELTDKGRRVAHILLDLQNEIMEL